MWGLTIAPCFVNVAETQRHANGLFKTNLQSMRDAHHCPPHRSLLQAAQGRPARQLPMAGASLPADETSAEALLTDVELEQQSSIDDLHRRSQQRLRPAGWLT